MSIRMACARSLGGPRVTPGCRWHEYMLTGGPAGGAPGAVSASGPSQALSGGAVKRVDLKGSLVLLTGFGPAAELRLAVA